MMNDAAKLSRKFLRNRKGTAEVIGSILFIVIIIFFFSNVYLWHDQATKQMNTQLSEKMNTPVSLTAANGELTVANNGGVDATLCMLWINDTAGHIYANLTNVGGHQVLVKAGSTITLKLGGTTEYVDATRSSVTDTWGNPITINYAPTGSVTFKILTTLGNTASCSYVSGTGTLAPAVTTDPESFKYYTLVWEVNQYTFNPTVGSSGYSIASSSNNVIFAVNLTNRDPNERPIQLNPNSQLFFLNTTNASASFPFYIVSTDLIPPVRTVSPYSTITLQYNEPQTIYFASSMPSSITPEAMKYQGGTSRTFTISLVLVGTIGTAPFGQNIPFVSVVSP